MGALSFMSPSMNMYQMPVGGSGAAGVSNLAMGGAAYTGLSSGAGMSDLFGGNPQFQIQKAQQQLTQMAGQLMSMGAHLEPESPLSQQMMAQMNALQSQSAQLNAASMMPSMGMMGGLAGGMAGGISSGMTGLSSGLSSGLNSGLGMGGGIGMQASELPQVQMAASMATAQALPQKYQGTNLGNLHTKLTSQAMTGSIGPRMGWLLNVISNVGVQDAKQAAEASSAERIGDVIELHNDLSTRLSTMDPHSAEGQELIDRLVELEKNIASSYDPASDKQIENLVDSLKILLDTLDEGTPKYLAVKQRITNLQKIRHANGGALNQGDGTGSSTLNLLLKDQLQSAIR